MKGCIPPDFVLNAWGQVKFSTSLLVWHVYFPLLGLIREPVQVQSHLTCCNLLGFHGAGWLAHLLPQSGMQLPVSCPDVLIQYWGDACVLAVFIVLVFMTVMPCCIIDGYQHFKGTSCASLPWKCIFLHNSSWRSSCAYLPPSEIQTSLKILPHNGR